MITIIQIYGEKSMIKIYGNIVSRTSRNLWVLDELEVDYEHISLDWLNKEQLSPEYLKINPAGKVPTLVDGNIIITESIAINLYLAQKYNNNGIWPTDDKKQALCLQWSLWATSELEPTIYPRYREFYMKKEQDRDQGLIKKLTILSETILDYLEKTLENNHYLTGADFCVADLNVAVIMEYLNRTGFKLDKWQKVSEWFNSCYNRKANINIQTLREPEAQRLYKALNWK